MSSIAVAGPNRPFNPPVHAWMPAGPAATAPERTKRSAEPAPVDPPPQFPSDHNAVKADTRLQSRVARWLTSGTVPDPLVPRNASIRPFVSQYAQAIGEPQVQAWFRAKGLRLSTIRVFSDSVVGVVSRDGKDSLVRFTTTDNCGWWEVSAKVRAAQKQLSPSDFGLAADPPVAPVPRHVILDFYGVQPPRDERSAPALGRQLSQDGWPPIPAGKRQQWRDAFVRSNRAHSDAQSRNQLAQVLTARLKNVQDDAGLKLDQQPFAAVPGSSLEINSTEPRQLFAQWLAGDAFKAFLQKTGLEASSGDLRISQGQLQQREDDGSWRSLQGYFNDEVGKNQDPAVQAMKGTLKALVKHSESLGDALYATPTWDLRQALAFSGLGSPTTLEQASGACAWLTTCLAPPPLAGNYARLSPYTPTPGALTNADCTTLKQNAAAVAALFEQFLKTPDHWQAVVSDADRRLTAFFDSPVAVAKADELAKALKLDETGIPREQRHQLLAAALKLSVQDSLPGKVGEIAGYEIYRSTNLGRTQQEVLADIQRHLQDQGASADTAPFLAHMMLAQAAPEMLVKLDPHIAAQTPDALKQNPQDIRIGSPAWLTLRLGCALADTLAGPGSSRAMNSTQVAALTRLHAQTPEQETLIKSLGARPLMDWAVMAGIFVKPEDGQCTAQHYEAAAEAFTAQQASTREAFNTLTAQPPTLTSVMVEQAALLFPEMTPDEIRELTLRRVYDARQHHQPQNVLLTELLLAQQEQLGPLVAANNWLNEYRSGEAKFRFHHPRVSQAEFDERIKQLPAVAPLLAPAIERYVNAMRQAQATVIKLMLAQLPLQDRKALEVGKVEFFSLRTATGESVEDDNSADSKVNQSKGRHGTLIRYETGEVAPRFGYFEVFPGTMRIIKRTDLPYSLPLGGEVKKGQKAFGPFAYVRTDFRHAMPAKFDFQAYESSSEPRAGVESSVIIEKAAKDLPAKQVPGNPGHARLPVPDTFNSAKTARIVEGILANSFNVPREPLEAYARQPTPYQQRRAYPFGSGDVFGPDNLRMVLSLLPFVGAVADLAQGSVAKGVTSLLIDFASFSATGGLAGARNFFKGVKLVLPFNGKAFALHGIKGASPLLQSVFNPLSGAVGVLKSGQKVTSLIKGLTKGELRLLDTGIYMPATAFEKCRWGVGVYDSVTAPAA